MNLIIKSFEPHNRSTQSMQVQMQDVFSKKSPTGMLETFRDNEVQNFYLNLLTENSNYQFKKDFNFPVLSLSCGSEYYYKVDDNILFLTDGIMEAINSYNLILEIVNSISEIYQLDLFHLDDFDFLNIYILNDVKSNQFFLNLDDGNGNLKANYNLSLGKPNHNWSDLSQVNLHFYLTYGVLMLAQEY